MRLFRHIDRYKEIILSILRREDNMRISKDQLLINVNSRLPRPFKLKQGQLTQVMGSIDDIENTTTRKYYDINLKKKINSKYDTKIQSSVYDPLKYVLEVPN